MAAFKVSAFPCVSTAVLPKKMMPLRIHCMSQVCHHCFKFSARRPFGLHCTGCTVPHFCSAGDAPRDTSFLKHPC